MIKLRKKMILKQINSGQICQFPFSLRDFPRVCSAPSRRGRQPKHRNFPVSLEITPRQDYLAFVARNSNFLSFKCGVTRFAEKASSRFQHVFAAIGIGSIYDNALAYDLT